MEKKPRIFTETSAWTDAMRAHKCPDKQLGPNDDPLKGMLGFRCHGCGEQFSIHKDAVKEQDPRLWESFFDVDKRVKMGKRLSRDDTSPMYVNLDDDVNKPVTVLVLKGDRVLHNKAYQHVEVSQMRTVTPNDGSGLKVESGTERTVITLQ